LCIGSMMLAGCHNITATPAAAKHVETTWKNMVSYCGQCNNGDVPSCKIATAMAAGELEFITDANSGVTMSKEYSQQVRILSMDMNRLRVLCFAGDENACKDGADLGQRGLRSVLDGIQGVKK
jgi:hypothetical protein